MVLRCLPYCYDVITDIVNSSLSSGKFPTSWKCGIITPIPKSADTSQFKNLRPITKLPFLSKILEKVVSSQLMIFLKVSKTIPDLQSGLQAGLTTAMTYVSNFVLKAYDNNKITALISLDFSKAFDTINHDIFGQKLKYYNFSDTTVNWFDSYLRNRSQRVCIQDDGDRLLSSPLNVHSGVPQGSGLGSDCYIIYAADLLRLQLVSIMILYADDAQILYSFKSENVQAAMTDIDHDLELIFRWTMVNSLNLNSDKTTFLLIDPSGKAAQTLEISIHLDDKTIQPTDSCRCLGLILDSK